MAAKKEPTFEQSLEELETIIDKVESGEIELEEALGFYEKGMKLVAHCRGVLDRAEKKIKELAAGSSGQAADIADEQGEED
ncbi:MAG: exodeoxyribonuclease VII small subunit [Phycisphaera sp.]|nr:exodeoxyribonuclease VII small subunit [Phycisphaera sp.]